MPMTQVVRNRLIALTAISAISVLPTFALTALGIKRWSKLRQSTNSVLSFILNLAGLSMGLAGVLLNLHKLEKDDVNHTGSFSCQLEGAVVMVCGVATAAGNVNIALERFLLVRRSRKMSLKEAYLMSAGSWVWGLAMGLFPVFVKDGHYVTTPSETVCFIQWWGTNPPVLVEAYLLAFMCFGAFAFIGYVYGAIALMVYHQSKSLEYSKVTPLRIKFNKSGSTMPKSGNRNDANIESDQPVTFISKSSSPSPPRFSTFHKDRHIYFKVVIIACGYVCCYGSIAAVASIGILEHSVAPAEVHYASGLLATMNPIFNAAVIGLLDPVYKL